VAGFLWLAGEPPGSRRRPAEKELNLPVQRPELVGRPPLQGIMELRIHPKEK